MESLWSTNENLLKDCHNIRVVIGLSSESVDDWWDVYLTSGEKSWVLEVWFRWLRLFHKEIDVAAVA